MKKAHNKTGKTNGFLVPKISKKSSRNPRISGMRRSRSAQISITFNWIYIMIAGGVILLFFIGIVVKQQSRSEQILSTDVLEIMEGIFTGASVSDDTINHIPAAGLRDYTFYFNCEDEYGEYGIEGLSNPIEDQITPLFSPLEIRSDEFILWSVPYHLPYKMIDMLMISSKHTKYVMLSSTDPFVTELIKLLTDEFNIDFVDSFDDVKMGANFHLRIIYLPGQFDNAIPASLQNLAPGTLSAIEFTGDQVTFYDNDATTWKKDKTLPVITMDEDRPAAKYAAMFAGNAKIYECNMRKAFRRAEFISRLHELKYTEIVQHHSSLTDPCNILVSKGKTMPAKLAAEAEICSLSLEGGCSEILNTANELQIFNQKLRQESCVQLY
tara:strand:- start:19764 stop:20909 length:1146 start_codon:yes stop_codon:yes gene_type:complete